MPNAFKADCIKSYEGNVNRALGGRGRRREEEAQQEENGPTCTAQPAMLGLCKPPANDSPQNVWMGQSPQEDLNPLNICM